MSPVLTVPARWRCQRAMGGLRPQLAGDVEFHLQGKTLEHPLSKRHCSEWDAVAFLGAGNAHGRWRSLLPVRRPTPNPGGINLPAKV